MEAKRLYKGKDADMYSAVASVMHFFEHHLPEFTAYDPSLDAGYLASFKAAFQNLILFLPTHDQERAVMQDEILIADLDKALAKCCTKYKDVKYYAGKAFPDNKEALKEFGEGTYSKVCTSRLRMVQFMETLYGVATKYKIELIAKNYTQAAITEIATLAAELRDDNNLQQLKKKERPTETRKRIEALNTFYAFGQQVAEAARMVFRHNQVLLGNYLLAKRHHPKTTKSWLILGSSTTRKIALPKLLKKFNLTLTNQGKETIEYWRADNIHETPFQKFYLEAEESMEVGGELPVKKFLVLRNPSQKEVRVVLKKEMKEK